MAQVTPERHFVKACCAFVDLHMSTIGGMCMTDMFCYAKDSDWQRRTDGVLCAYDNASDADAFHFQEKENGELSRGCLPLSGGL